MENSGILSVLSFIILNILQNMLVDHGELQSCHVEFQRLSVIVPMTYVSTDLKHSLTPCPTQIHFILNNSLPLTDCNNLIFSYLPLSYPHWPTTCPTISFRPSDIKFYLVYDYFASFHRSVEPISKKAANHNVLHDTHFFNLLKFLPSQFYAISDSELCSRLSCVEELQIHV